MTAVSRIVLEIGQFSGVEVGALEFAFSVFKKGTILEGTEFEYQTPPLVLYCIECENQYLGDWEDLRCPVCMGTGFEVIQGRELAVKSIAGASDGS